MLSQEVCVCMKSDKSFVLVLDLWALQSSETALSHTWIWTLRSWISCTYSFGTISSFWEDVSFPGRRKNEYLSLTAVNFCSWALVHCHPCLCSVYLQPHQILMLAGYNFSFFYLIDVLFGFWFFEVCVISQGLWFFSGSQILLVHNAKHIQFTVYFSIIYFFLHWNSV